MNLGSPKGKPAPSSSGSPMGLWSVPVCAGVHLCSALRRGGGAGCCSSQRTIAEGQAGASQAMHKVHPAPAASWGSTQEVEQPEVLPDWGRVSSLDEAFRRW